MLHLRSMRAFVSLAAITATLAGCANSATTQSAEEIARANQRTHLELQKSRYGAPNAPSGPLRERNGLFLAGATRENGHGVGLPGKYASQKFSFVNASPMTFRDVAELITRQTKIPVIARDGDVGYGLTPESPISTQRCRLQRECSGNKSLVADIAQQQRDNVVRS